MLTDSVQIDFHDWRLMEITVRKVREAARPYDHEVKLLIEDDDRLVPIAPRRFEVLFHKVRGLRIVADLVVKTMFYDSIADAMKLPLADEPELPDLFDDWYRSVTPHEVPNRSNLRLYKLTLVPDVGTIEILAEEIILTELTAGS